ncbi:acyloxyacyl hydrolase [Marinobacter sp. SS21]|uniref:acyloxyacyl hydrolase n=1 Tax=Marinobacter sp. SS21 TaxID=2979460 RepID=UPI00232B528D|nr:acyloxyacyl hydrolase [Marinobacter sp. SS21]MDC0664274.1 acyloxyacyl hydrolase [Marinobacter sp. SS21]
MKNNARSPCTNAGNRHSLAADLCRLSVIRLSLHLLITTLLGLHPIQAYAEGDPALLNLSIGEVGLDRSLDNATRYGLEYRFQPMNFYQLIPTVGNVWVDNGATFTYFEMRRDFPVREHWLLTPSFGLGVFHEGRGLRLGHSTEFRSGVELSYRFPNRYRLGLAIYHLSNGGLSKENPGTESVVCSVSIPM